MRLLHWLTYHYKGWPLIVALWLSVNLLAVAVLALFPASDDDTDDDINFI